MIENPHVLDDYPTNHHTWLKPINIHVEDTQDYIAITIGRDKEDRIILEILNQVEEDEQVTAAVFQYVENSRGSFDLQWETGFITENPEDNQETHTIVEFDEYVMKTPAGEVGTNEVQLQVHNKRMENLL